MTIDRPHLARQFAETFGRSPHVIASAPGRINIIGEHLDYNGGCVLPMAIDMRTYVASAQNPNGAWNARSLNTAESWTHKLSEPLSTEPGSGSAYIFGTLAELQAYTGTDLGGLDLLVHSEIAPGVGLASSAALEAAVLGAAAALIGAQIQPHDQAQICQRAEHRHAGTPCGLMDQLCAVMGRRDHALLIDCRSHAVRHVPLPEDADLAWCIVQSGVRHALADGAYALRRAECESAAHTLGMTHLAEASTANLEQAPLSSEERRRVRHVASEQARVHRAAKLLDEQPSSHTALQELGELMFASHRSLRDDFQVSCPQLDAIIDAADALRNAGDVYGARMTGAGFGGAAILLARRSRLPVITAHLQQALSGSSLPAAPPIAVHPSEGLRLHAEITHLG